MSHVYSSRAHHLSKIVTYKPGFFSAWGLAVFNLVLAWFLSSQIVAEGTPTLKFVVFAVAYAILFPILRYAYISYRKHNSHRFPFNQFSKQENSVLGQLAALPEEFSVFHRVELPDHRPLHFVVTSRTGIFAVRVVHVDGVIGFDGHELTHNGAEMNEDDLVYQTLSQAKALEGYLTQKLGNEVTIKPLLVFSAHTIVTQLNFWEAEDVCLTRLDKLDDYLISHLSFKSNVDIIRARQVLLSLVVK